MDRNSYRLSDHQKKEISTLLELPAEQAPQTFDALEHLMNHDAWLEFDPEGNANRTKVAARKIRDLKLISKSLDELGKALGKIDPDVLCHLEDEFSFFHFEISQRSMSEKTSMREQIQLKTLITRTSEWARYAGNRLESEEGTGYFYRFFAEIEAFWEWNIQDSVKLTNSKYRRLIAILLDIDEDTAKTQLKRWRASKRGDKPQE